MSKPERNGQYQAVIASPLPGGPFLGIRMEEGRLLAIDYLEPGQSSFVQDDEGVEQAVAWLHAYFSRSDSAEALPVQPQGTAFQQRVWQRLRRIPPGQVMYYGELAKELGSSPRAVAGACRANPVPILIPCHRVIAANGPGGYMGQTGGEALAIKQWLLQHEGYV